MDVVLYGQLYNEAMMGMDTLFDDMKDSLKNFSKKRNGLLRSFFLIHLRRRRRLCAWHPG